MTKAFKTVDSQRYLLPQRRNRCWGAAIVNTGKETSDDFTEAFTKSLESLESTFQFPVKMNFGDLPVEPPKAGRHEKLLEAAKQAEGTQDVYVDCSTTESRCDKAVGVLPCVTPTHPVYSGLLERYMGPRDFMQAQGWWESCFAADVYSEMIKTIAQDLCGNGFSSTVCQATTLATMVSAPAAWGTMGGKAQDQSHASHEVIERVKRRVRSKRSAPEFDDEQKPSKKTKRVKKRQYRRKVAGEDSRKKNKGKGESATIWQKEQL